MEYVPLYFRPEQLTDSLQALPIHYASLEGREETVRLLLELGGSEQLLVMVWW